MSGIEVAGLVLGGFPILLNCLDYYRQGFEPLEEWWNFRRHFIAFVDDLRHQMMRYNENIIRLLNPIISDTDELTRMVEDPKCPRWTDPGLEPLLRQRLATEADRFLRIIERMHDIVQALYKLLQIEDGKFPWIGTSGAGDRPWQWHFRRLQISFSKGKHKKIKKLAAHNQELQDILGYSERVIPISNQRKTSEPVSRLEKSRQQALSAHNALSRHWRHPKNCGKHEARLFVHADITTYTLDILFHLHGGVRSSHQPTTQEVTMEAYKGTSPGPAPEISSVKHSEILMAAQESIAAQKTLSKGKATFVERISEKITHRTSFIRFPSQKRHSRATSSVSSSTISVQLTSPDVGSSPQISPASSNTCQSTHRRTSSSPGPAKSPSTQCVPDQIPDLCSFLASESSLTGLIQDEYDRYLAISKSTKVLGNMPLTSIRLISLPELLAAYHTASIYISRKSRFEIATHLASVLLQMYLSPWLPEKWSKHNFYFLQDTATQTLCCTYPMVRQSFPSPIQPTPSPARAPNPPSDSSSLLQVPSNISYISEEDARATLFSIGVMLLELIFGQNIEDCQFRKDYMPNDQPNDQTDICTARRWAKKVLGECGANIDDVVRRCLDCSFGPRPCWTDGRFRESVYEGVIKPLASYSQIWPEVMK